MSDKPYCMKKSSPTTPRQAIINSAASEKDWPKCFSVFIGIMQNCECIQDNGPAYETMTFIIKIQFA
jgi:hypothetical protein